MPEKNLSLNGEWQFGLGDQSGAVLVPGVWELQGYRQDVEGPAIYRRMLEIPADWSGSQITLHFDAVSYYVDVYVNGIHVGTHEGLWTAFSFDVTGAVYPGQDNAFELRIVKPGKGDATYHFRDVLVGFIPYISLTFGGPWQGITLKASSGPRWESPHINPDRHTGEVRVRARLGGIGLVETGCTVTVLITDPSGAIAARQSELFHGSLDGLLTIANPVLWGSASPALYCLSIRLELGGVTLCETSSTFGFRELSAAGDQLLFNGMPIHLRGVLSWGWDPATLSPSPSEQAIRDEFRRVRSMGFNLLKLCLFVPSDLLFRIADEEGMFLWLELPLWYQRMNDHLRRQALMEYTDIFEAVNHHPSIILYSLGCELGHDMADASLLSDLNSLARASASGVLVCDNSGSGEAYSGLSFDFADFNDYHFYCDLHNFIPLVDHFNRDWRKPRPWIFGEFCDCDDFRDVDELTQANGGTRPWWRDLLGIDGRLDRWGYSVQELRMAQLNLPFTTGELVHISRKQSFLVRKVILEHVRARSSIGGYVITGLRDTPISTSGIFDDLLRPKYEASEFTLFNTDVVLVLEQGRSRVWRNGGDRIAPKDRFNHVSGSTADFRVVLANASRTLKGRELRWELTDLTGNVAVSGQAQLVSELPAGRPYEIASIQCRMPHLESPAQFTLRVEVDAGDIYRNEWPVWVYPQVTGWDKLLHLYDPTGNLTPLEDIVRDAVSVRQASDVSGVLLTSVLTPEIWKWVCAGGHALLIQPGAGAFPATPCTFWRESIRLLYQHPILSAFPHQGWAGLQFYNLAPDYALDTAKFAADWAGVNEVSPVIRRLDARSFSLLDYMVEIRAGRGMLLATSLNFMGGMGDQVSVFADSCASRFLLREAITFLSKQTSTSGVGKTVN